MADRTDHPRPGGSESDAPAEDKVKTTFLFEEMRSQERRNRVIMVAAILLAAAVGAGFFFWMK